MLMPNHFDLESCLPALQSSNRTQLLLRFLDFSSVTYLPCFDWLNNCIITCSDAYEISAIKIICLTRRQ